MEYDENGVLKNTEVTYAYKLAKITAIASGGAVSRMEDFLEEHPFFGAICMAGITAISISRVATKNIAILNSIQEENNNRRQGPMKVEVKVTDAKTD